MARCGASYLNAIGLPELIVETDEEYEALAFELATNKSLLTSIKEKLVNNRTATPLFDTKTYTQNLEKSFYQAHSLSDCLEKKEAIWISSTPIKRDPETNKIKIL